LRMNEEHFYALGLRRSGAAMEAVLRTRLGRLDIASVVGVLEGREVVLGVEGSADSYVFTARDGSGRVARTSPLDAKFLSAEFAGGFTGVFVGMYAATSSAGSGTVARFDWFDYRPAPRASARWLPDREDSCHVAAGS
jgi:xylan 1,4-beta-xylosidase